MFGFKKSEGQLKEEEKVCLEKIEDLKREISELTTSNQENIFPSHIEINSKVLSCTVSKLFKEKKRLKSIQRSLGVV